MKRGMEEVDSGRQYEGIATMCLQDLTLPVGNRHCKLPTNVHSDLQSSLFSLGGHEVDVNGRLYKSATTSRMTGSRRFGDQCDSGYASELRLIK